LFTKFNFNFNFKIEVELGKQILVSSFSTLENHAKLIGTRKLGNNGVDYQKTSEGGRGHMTHLGHFLPSHKLKILSHFIA
jgi:hypothetical protein